jgi:hypothetical protein
MVRVGRVVVVTLGLVGAGILFGAIAGGTAFTLVTLVAGEGISFGHLNRFFSAPWLVTAMLSWLLLRRLLGQMFWFPPLGQSLVAL